MTYDSAPDRQQQWELVVRRSFEISDAVAHTEARKTLIRSFEGYLQATGWQLAPRGIAEPIVDALMLADLAGNPSDPEFDTRESAQRLLAHGISVIDPEHLVFDARFDYPSEILTATRQMLARVERYWRERSDD